MKTLKQFLTEAPSKSNSITIDCDVPELEAADLLKSTGIKATNIVHKGFVGSYTVNNLTPTIKKKIIKFLYNDGEGAGSMKELKEWYPTLFESTANKIYQFNMDADDEHNVNWYKKNMAPFLQKNNIKVLEVKPYQGYKIKFKVEANESEFKKIEDFIEKLGFDYATDYDILKEGQSLKESFHTDVESLKMNPKLKTICVELISFSQMRFWEINSEIDSGQNDLYLANYNSERYVGFELSGNTVTITIEIDGDSYTKELNVDKELENINSGKNQHLNKLSFKMFNPSVKPDSLSSVGFKFDRR